MNPLALLKQIVTPQALMQLMAGQPDAAVAQVKAALKFHEVADLDAGEVGSNGILSRANHLAWRDGVKMKGATLEVEGTRILVLAFIEPKE